MHELVAITKALADENRLRLLHACRDGERCACQLVELLGLSGSTVSKHLSILRAAGLLDSRRDGRWIHYRLPDEPSPAARDAIALALRHVAGTRRAQADAERLGEILAMDPEVLCRMQRGESCCPPASNPAEAAETRAAQGGVHA